MIIFQDPIKFLFFSLPLLLHMVILDELKDVNITVSVDSLHPYAIDKLVGVN